MLLVIGALLWVHVGAQLLVGLPLATGFLTDPEYPVRDWPPRAHRAVSKVALLPLVAVPCLLYAYASYGPAFRRRVNRAVRRGYYQCLGLDLGPD